MIHKFPQFSLVVISSLITVALAEKSPTLPEGVQVKEESETTKHSGEITFSYEGAVYTADSSKIVMRRESEAAGKEKIIAEGFGNSGSGFGSFSLGPDGRIYGAIGDRGLKITTKEGKTYEYADQGVVFRFEPDGTAFEVFCYGLRNPAGVAFDEQGNAFTVDGNGPENSRVLYLAEGGDYGWKKSQFPQTTGELSCNIPAIGNFPAKFPSHIVSHPGTGFLEKEKNHFFVSVHENPKETSIWSFSTKPSGAGMALDDAPRKIVSGIHSTGISYSWDGKLLFTAPGENKNQLISLSAGEKTWKAPDAASAAKYILEGFEKRSSAELLNLLKHPDFRIRLHAQLALTRKSDALNRFSEATISTSPFARIHGIWGLGILARRGAAALPYTDFASVPSLSIGKDAEKKLLGLAEHKDEEIRCQAVRTLVDATSNGNSDPLEISSQLLDPSLRVRFFASLLAGKRKMSALYSSACDMIAENENKDAFLLHAGACALQGILPDPNALIALENSETPPALRLAAAIALYRMKSPDISAFLRDEDDQISTETIRLICNTDNNSSRLLIAALLDELSEREKPWPPTSLLLILQNSFIIGDTQNAKRLITFSADTSQPEALRIEALRLLHQWTEPSPTDSSLAAHRQLLPGRPQETIVPILTEQLPAILAEKNSVETAARELATFYKIQLPAPTAK